MLTDGPYFAVENVDLFSLEHSNLNHYPFWNVYDRYLADLSVENDVRSAPIPRRTSRFGTYHLLGKIRYSYRFHYNHTTNEFFKATF